MKSREITNSRRSAAGLIDIAGEIGPSVALFLSLPIIFAASSPFSFGVWRSAEPLVVAFHGTAALCTVALILALVHRAADTAALLVHPFVMVPAILSLLSALMAPIAAYPLVSIFGSPQSGEGAIWYANLAVMAACALHAVNRPRHWRMLALAAIIVVFGVVAIKVVAARERTYQLFWVNDFVGYFALALPVIVLRYSTQSWLFLRVCAIAASLLVLVVSTNKAAAALFLIGAGIIGIGVLTRRWPRLDNVLFGRAMSAIAVTFLAVAPLYFTVSGRWINGIESLRSRHLVATVMEEAQKFDVGSLMHGNGWGHTQNALVTHLNAANESLWNLRWDFLAANYSHSHNWLIESLYSVGIPGALLTLALYLVMPVHGERSVRHVALAFAGCLGALNSLWFPLAFFIPFMALAMGALAGAPRAVSWRPVTARLVGLFLAGVFVLQAAAAIVLLDYGKRTSAALAVYRGPPGDAVTHRFPQDFRGADYALITTVRRQLTGTSEKTFPKGDPRRAKQRKVLHWLVEDLRTAIARSPSTLLLIAGISVFSEVMYTPSLSWLKPDYEKKSALWDTWVEELLLTAPRRTDVAIAYLSWLLEKGKNEKLAQKAEEILRQNPNDPVGLYYKGAALIRDAQPDQRSRALHNLRRGLEQGIERFMPIDPALKQLIFRAK